MNCAGRGRQVIAVARTADVVMMMLDATKGEVQQKLLEAELEAVGIRLNKRKPNIYFKVKKAGGLSFNSTLPLTHVDEKLVQLILHEYKLFNAEVMINSSPVFRQILIVELSGPVPRGLHSGRVDRRHLRQPGLHALPLRLQQNRSNHHRGGRSHR
jgi:ribosome-interacting GTPase 1